MRPLSEPMRGLRIVTKSKKISDLAIGKNAYPRVSIDSHGITSSLTACFDHFRLTGIRVPVKNSTQRWGWIYLKYILGSLDEVDYDDVSPIFSREQDGLGIGTELGVRWRKLRTIQEAFCVWSQIQFEIGIKNEMAPIAIFN